MIHSFIALIYICCGEIVLLPLFVFNHWFLLELLDSKNWKRHYCVYLIFKNKKRSILKVAERRKRMENIIKREKSFRIGNHFSEIIRNVRFFLRLNMIFAPFRLPVILEKLHQKSTWTQQNDFYWTKCDPKLTEKLSSK